VTGYRRHHLHKLCGAADPGLRLSAGWLVGSAEDLRHVRKSRLKGGCRQDCLPHHWLGEDGWRSALLVGTAEGNAIASLSLKLNRRMTEKRGETAADGLASARLAFAGAAMAGNEGHVCRIA